MGTTPTEKSIIGTFINGRNATDDFLQLANNHGGTVFGWIDADGHLQGSLLINGGGAPGGSVTDVQFNKGGIFAGDDGFTYDDSAKSVGGVGGLLIGGVVQSAPTLFLAQVGSVGPVTYTYAIVAIKGNLNIATSAQQTTTIGNLSLSGLNYNTLSWTPVSGATSYAIWRWVPLPHAFHGYSLNDLAVDPNGYLQKITTSGTSGAPNSPTWNSTIGGTTNDGTAVWTNQGFVTASSVGQIGTTSSTSFNDTGFVGINGNFITAIAPLNQAALQSYIPYVVPEPGWTGITTGLTVTGGGWSAGVFSPACHFGDPVDLVDFLPVSYSGSFRARFEFYDINTTRAVNTADINGMAVYSQNSASSALVVGNLITNTYGSYQNTALSVGADASAVTTTFATQGIFSGCGINSCTITGDDGGEFGIVVPYRAECECYNSSVAQLMGYQSVTAPGKSTVTNQIGYRSIPRSLNSIGDVNTITNQVDFRAESFIESSGTSNVTNSIAFHAQNKYISGVSLSAAFYADDQGTAANAWALYTAGQTPSRLGGTLTFAGSGSGSATIGVAASAGTPNGMLLPVSTGTPGQLLSTDGGSPQQLSWVSASGTGTVMSVGLIGDGVIFNTSVTNSPVTGSGNLTPVLLTQTANTVLAGPASAGPTAPTFRALVAADIPNLAASKITSGQLALARGGTNADLSATGGASQVLKQVSSGAAITVGQVNFTDLAGSIAIGQTALTTLGDIGYANSTPALARLAGNITSTKKYLSQTGTGAVSAAPAWAQIAAADLSDGTTGSGAIVLAVSPALTGTPTAPTVVSSADNTTKIATTAFVQSVAFNAGAVTSVFGRAGVVVAATNDYSFSQISGKAGLAQGGTNADLSATGGASQVLKQVSSGAAITVGQLAASDLSNGVTGSGSVVLATSPTLAGVPLSTTPATSDSTTKIATTAYVQAQKYAATFSSATTLTVTGATHGLGSADLIVAVYDSATGTRNLLIPNSVSIDTSSFNVTVTFASLQSGRIVIHA